MPAARTKQHEGEEDTGVRTAVGKENEERDKAKNKKGERREKIKIRTFVKPDIITVRTQNNKTTPPLPPKKSSEALALVSSLV